ncbi:MAG: glycosyltransferase [Candidatus Krumholzibacteriaceae bacterium]|jgi:glycosyltransferase involved in cell wall biosynthesis
MTPKVLQVIYSLYRGGAERIIAAQILGTDRRRFEHLVCSITGGSDLVVQMSDAGARVFLLGKRRRGDMTAVTKLASIIRRERIDLLHLHNSTGMFWGTLAQIASGTGAPIVRTEHLPYFPEALPPLFRWVYPRFTKRAGRIICVSGLVRQSFAERFPELAGKFVEIPNGIRLQDYSDLPPRAECRARFKLPPDVKLIGTVGRMVPQKNHKLLIEALSLVRRAVPDAHLAIVGEGELRDGLAAYAADLGVSECVSLLGETRDIGHFYGAIDVFCLSSDFEGMPLVLLEALAAGVPAVSTEVEGIHEIMEDGRTGLLVPKGSAQLLAGRIVELLRDPSRAAGLAANGRKMVRERFSAEKMIEAIEAVYEEVLANRPR